MDTNRLGRWLPPAEVAKEFGVTVETLSKMEAKGLLPPRVRISPRKSGWFSTTLQRFLNTETA